MRTRTAVIALILAFSTAVACVPKGETLGFREHVLNRIGYGPNAWSRDRMAQLGGAAAYIEEQLNPASIPNGPLEAMLDAYVTLDLTFAERVLLTDGMMPGMPMMSDTALIDEQENSKILRAVYSRRQLEEVLVDFWFNHFNVKINNGGFSVAAIAPYERDAIRPHVLGRFEDLLVAVAQSPAMLYYLDNWRNIKDVEWAVSSRMNENYGRELLELHTVGVDNYTQQDVVEVTRCFTGWTVDKTLDDGFWFDAENHDDGSKLVLGELLVPAGGGIEDGLSVLAYLAHHPATAQTIARKLLIRFVTEDPSQELVDQIAGVFLATDGDLREVTRAVLQVPEFSSPALFRSKVKRPFVLAASAARALGTTSTAITQGAHAVTAWAGEPLYRMRAPTGYPDVSGAWLGVGSLIERINFIYTASRMQNGYSWVWPIVDPGDDQALVTELQDWLLMTPVSSETRQALVDYGAIQPHYVVGDKRLEVMSYAMLTSPEFFLH